MSVQVINSKDRVIHGHEHVDLDLVASIWFARRFIPGFKQAKFQFHPAKWQGTGMGKHDLALDLEAGGKGFKGLIRPDGQISSCFAMLVASFADEATQLVLKPLIRYVEAVETKGSIYWTELSRFEDLSQEVYDMFSITDMAAAVAAFRIAFHGDDYKICAVMSQYLDGILVILRQNIRAITQAQEIEITGGVAIVPKSTASLNRQLKRRGALAIIFVDGNNLGLIKSNRARFDIEHPAILSVIEAAGEKEEWFLHPNKWIFARGTRKNPMDTPSKVDPQELSWAVQQAIRDFGQVPRIKHRKRNHNHFPTGNGDGLLVDDNRKSRRRCCILI